MKKNSLYLFVSIFFLVYSLLEANNIQLSNVTIVDKNTADHTAYIKFDLSWENSWRVTDAPNNWDAAWLFAKYKVTGGEWHHVKISLNNTDHSVENNNGTDILFSTKKPSSESTYGTGCLVYRANEGTGTINLAGVKLKWTYGENGIADDANVSIQVFGIEMVYIPEGPFELGGNITGSGYPDYPSHFHQGANVNNPFYVNGSQIVVGNDSFNKLWVADPLNRISIDIGTVNISYPTGYKAFYSMKYNVSQKQYVDFLNSLTRIQQSNNLGNDGINILGLTPSNSNIWYSHSMSRMGIKCSPVFINTTDPVSFGCDLNGNGVFNEINDGQSLYVNLPWSRFTSFAEWAGLRLLTELEYEKICRGPLPAITDEVVNGTASLTLPDYGSRRVSNPGTDYETITGSGEFIFDREYRCGITATSTTNRIQADAGYFGCLDLHTSLLCEDIQSSYDIPSNSYILTNGNGEVNTNGRSSSFEQRMAIVRGRANEGIPMVSKRLQYTNQESFSSRCAISE